MSLLVFKAKAHQNGTSVNNVTSVVGVELDRKAVCFNRNIFTNNESTISPVALHKRANSSLALREQWKIENRVLRSELKR